MKKLLMCFLVVLPLGSYASIVKFECKSKEILGIHKFDAKGIISTDEFNRVEGIVSIQTEKAQAQGSAQVFEELKVTGTIQHYEAGKISTSAFDQLVLTTNDSYVKTVNIFLDYELDIASQVLSVDNFLFRSNCFVEPVVR